MGISGSGRGDGGSDLGNVDRGAGPRPVRGDHGRVVVDVGDGDGNRLGVGQGAVGDLHGDVIDVVATGVGRILVIGRRNKRQGTGRGIDRELGGIRAAG